MISADFMAAASVALAVQWKPLDVPVEGEEGIVGGDHRAMRRQKRKPDDIAAAEHHSGFACGVRRTIPRLPPSDRRRRRDCRRGRTPDPAGDPAREKTR